MLNKSNEGTSQRTETRDDTGTRVTSKTKGKQVNILLTVLTHKLLRLDVNIH